MKMKTIEITENNANWIIGRLNRFFRHKNFIVWHQFNGGMKKRISRYLKFPHNKYTPYTYDINTSSLYLNVELFPVSDIKYPDVIARITLSDCSMVVIALGDRVTFLGNRIIISNDRGTNGSRFYQCFQICK